MTLLRHTLTSLCCALLLSGSALAQAAPPDSELVSIPKLDYSYCRFDSVTVRLMEQHIPRPILATLAKSGMHPRLLPVFMTAMDVNFENPDAAPDYKVLYANNGTTYATLVVLKRGDNGAYEETWSTQAVPPAPRVRLRAVDLNADGRPDILASARGGEPNYEALVALEFNEEGLGRPLVSPSRSAFAPEATFGIGFAVLDSLGRNGRPAIEVWHDDSTSTADFVRVRLQYSDSARIFLPESVDSLKELPFWCRSRRPSGGK